MRFGHRVFNSSCLSLNFYFAVPVVTWVFHLLGDLFVRARSSNSVLQNAVDIFLSLLDLFFGLEQVKNAVFDILLPSADVDVSVGEFLPTLSVLLPFLDVSGVNGSVMVDSAIYQLSFFKLSFESVTSFFVMQLSITVVKILNKLTLISISWTLFNTISGSYAFNKVTLVIFSSELPLLMTFAMVFFVDELTVVKHTSNSVNNSSLSMPFTVFPVAVINSFIFIFHSALAVELLILGEASVPIPVFILKFTEPFVMLEIRS